MKIKWGIVNSTFHILSWTQWEEEILWFLLPSLYVSFFIAIKLPSTWKNNSILSNKITLELEIKINSFIDIAPEYIYISYNKNDDIIVSLLVVSISLLLNLPIVK